MKISKTFKAFFVIGLIFFVALAAVPAFASSTSGFKYEEPLQKFADSMSGPVAYALAILGAVCILAVVLFGGDMTGLTRSVVLFIIGVGFIAFIAELLKSMFGLTGSLI